MCGSFLHVGRFDVACEAIPLCRRHLHDIQGLFLGMEGFKLGEPDSDPKVIAVGGEMSGGEGLSGVRKHRRLGAAGRAEAYNSLIMPGSLTRKPSER
jgi:hypothetical protein